jgi:uncharacterized protein (DUF1800 family)
MAEEPEEPSQGLLHRVVTRRNVLGTAAGAAVLAAAYNAFGEDLLSSGGGAAAPTGGTSAAAVPESAKAIVAEDVKISHLLRRAGFGTTREEYDRYQSMGLGATIDELVHFENVDDGETERLAQGVQPSADAIGSASAWWLVRMANTKRPLQEKMTLFWHGLLTSQLSVVRDPVAMAAQNQFFRDNAFGRFPAILKGITHDPAMMVYLDIAGSRKTAPNENYARELMELFALGEGHYSEEDVREGARAFTGWAVPRQRGEKLPVLGEPVFVARYFDDGEKMFLGQTGNFDAGDVVDIITNQDESARYITRRLFQFFIHPQPSNDDLQPFVETYLSNDKSIGATVESMLRSDVFYSPKAYRAIVKSPVEYAVGAIRALGMQASITNLLAAGRGRQRDGGVLGDMGQIPLEPPNVAGWPGGTSWLNSSTIFARLNFVNSLGAAENNRRGALATPSAPKFASASEAVDHYLPFLVDNNLPDETRKLLPDYAGGPDAPLSMDGQRDLVYLMLAMPQYHLA